MKKVSFKEERENLIYEEDIFHKQGFYLVSFVKESPFDFFIPKIAVSNEGHHLLEFYYLSQFDSVIHSILKESWVEDMETSLTAEGNNSIITILKRLKVEGFVRDIYFMEVPV